MAVAGLIMGAFGVAAPVQAREDLSPQDYSECVVEGFVYFVEGSSSLYIDHRLDADGTLQYTTSRDDALRLRYDYSGPHATLDVVDPRSDLVAVALAQPDGGDATLAGAEAAILVGAYELSATPATISTSIGEVVATTDFYSLEPVRWASLVWPNPGGGVVSAEPLLSSSDAVILPGDPVAYTQDHGPVQSTRSAMIWDLGPRCPETVISTYPIVSEPVDVGDEVWIGATITSSKGGQIDGVATLYVCEAAPTARVCATGGTSLGSSAAAGFPADEVSMPFTPTARGYYCFRTEFVGWGLDDAVSADADSCLQVPTATEVTPTPSTSPSTEAPQTTPGESATGGDNGGGSAGGPIDGVPASGVAEMPVVLGLAFAGVLVAGIAGLTVFLVQRHRRPRPTTAAGG